MNIKNTILAAVLFIASFSAGIYPSAMADSNNTVKKICTAPAVLTGAATGIIVGTPIATTRVTGKSIKSMIHEFDGDSFSYKFWGRPLAVPVGIIAGTIKGCIVGPKNAIRYAKEKPFSKEAFSLKDLQ